ncbi:MAG: hypothetical protein AAGA48_21270 [Myxococcota bacterium]
MTAVVQPGAEIHPTARLGDFCKVYRGAVIERDCVIGDHCVIGLPSAGEDARPVHLGAGSTVRSHTVIYEDSQIGACVSTGHHVVIRERSRIGDRVSLGSFTDVEGHCTIGDDTRLHGYVHIGKGSRIGRFCWIFSLVTLTNDPLPPSAIERPVVLGDGVVVCVGCTVLPGTSMGDGAFATAGTVVQGEIEAGRVVTPDGSERHVSTLMDLTTMTRHPFIRHLRQRYPDVVHADLDALAERIAATRRFGQTPS